MTDEINKAAHYNKNKSGVECITVIRHMTYNVGAAVKYLWRGGEKLEPGSDSAAAACKDYNKAIYYAIDEIHRLGGKVTVKLPVYPAPDAN